MDVEAVAVVDVAVVDEGKEKREPDDESVEPKLNGLAVGAVGAVDEKVKENGLASGMEVVAAEAVVSLELLKTYLELGISVDTSFTPVNNGLAPVILEKRSLAFASEDTALVLLNSKDKGFVVASIDTAFVLASNVTFFSSLASTVSFFSSDSLFKELCALFG